MKEKKLFEKFLVVAVLITLTFGNWGILGNWIVVKASSYVENLQVTNNKSVKFDIGIEEKNVFTHEKEVDINDKLILTSYLIVENDGYLKDICIKFEGDKKNYVITNIKQEEDIIKNSTQEEINLKQISKGEFINLEIEIEWANKFVDINSLREKNNIKLTAIYVDTNGKENKIEKNVEIRINWVCRNEIKLESKITKYTDYKLKNEQGVLLEQTIKISQDGKNKLPFEKVKLEAEELKLDGKKADRIEIKRENNEIQFENKDGIIKINEEPKNNKEELEYIVRYIFKDKEIIDSLELELSMNANIKTIFAEEDKKIELHTEKELIEKQGDIIQLEGTKTSEISKGRLYANCNQEVPQYETKYDLEYTIKTAYKADIEKIKITADDVIATDDESKEYKLNENTVVCNYIKVNKDNLHYTLGDDGYIEVFDLNNEQIGKIDKTSKLDEDGNYYLEFDPKPSKMCLITSVLQNDGELNIIQNKTILPNLGYTRDEIKKFKELNDKLLLELFEKDTENATISDETAIKSTLLETTTEAQMTLSTNKLASIVKNENVEIKIALNNNQEDRDLYKNPKFEIEFPAGVKDVTVKESNILFDDELKIETVKKFERDGKIVLEINLEGTQTKFLLNEYIDGTTILINTDIEVDIRTVSKTDSILMKYYNENAISYNKEDCGEYECKVEFISPKQMIVGQEISGYSTEEKKVTSILQGEKSEKLEIYTDAKKVQNNIFIMNNNTYDCEGITILVRIPTKNNKDILTGESLGTTIDTKLLDVQLEGLDDAQVYYSTSEGATYNLELKENNWITSSENIQNIKTIMIKTNSKVEQGRIINLKYNFEIPANLEHNEYLYGDVGVYYKDPNNVEYVVKPDKIELTTGRGPQMDIKQQASVEKGEDVYEGQKIKYTITVKNTGIDPIYNLRIKEILPEYVIYSVYTRNNLSLGYDEKNPNAQMLIWDVEEVKLDEEVKVEFNVEVNNLPSIEEYYRGQENFVEENEKYYLKEGETKTEIEGIPEITLRNKVAVDAKDLGKEVYAEDYENIIKKSEILVNETSSISEDVPLKENDNLTYDISIQNNKEEDISNIELTKILPEGLEYVDIYTIVYNAEYEEWERAISGSYKEEERKISINVGTIKKDEIVYIKLMLKTAKLKEEEYKREVETTSKVTGDNIKAYVVTPVKNTIVKPKIETEYLCNNNSKYLINGDVLEYTIKVTNIGEIIANNVKIEDALPKELELINARYSIGEAEVTTIADKDNKIEVTGNLNLAESIVLKIKAKTTAIPQNVTLENTPKVSIANENTKEIGTISHILERTEKQGMIVEDKLERTYNISGAIWYDENGDGINGSAESNLPDVQLRIIDETNGNIVKELSSNGQGTYSVDGLEEGNYLVMFEYDNNKYDVTEYRKNGVSEEQNSDVIQIDGEDNNLIAISDTIRIKNNDFSNINIGLTEKQKFDFKLESEVVSISEQNGKDTKTHSFNNTKMAKIDIDPAVLADTTVYVEYKITIKNEGNVAGFVKNIVNYMPEGMKFNSEINANWYIGNDGNLYTNSLGNEVIKPGESKELKLILIKEMTEVNTGLTSNITEILETYNELGLEDIDSKENNRLETEDDYSQALALITVQLGGNMGNLLAIIISLVLVAMGVYAVKNKWIKVPVKKDKIYK